MWTFAKLSKRTKENYCAICMNDVNCPKNLRCGHTFCNECIELLITYSDRNAKCPLCRKLIQKKPRVINRHN